MKTIALILCGLILAMGNGSAIAMADDLAMAAPVPITAHSILGGELKSVSWADPVKGTKSEIVVIDSEKKTTHILVMPTTTLWDADAKAIMPDKIVALSRVNVIYFTTDEGLNVGKSIRILK